MFVPGATISGLIRPSSAGPRLENAAIPSTLLLVKSAPNGAPPRPKTDQQKFSGTLAEHPPVGGRKLSEEPTVSTFFAVPGALIESASTTPSRGFLSKPSLPAATTNR